MLFVVVAHIFSWLRRKLLDAYGKTQDSLFISMKILQFHRDSIVQNLDDCRRYVSVHSKTATANATISAFMASN